MKISEDLVYEILSAVSEIPEGKVATYGQIAALIGRERNARLVGKVLSVADYYGDYPCHSRCSYGISFSIRTSFLTDLHNIQFLCGNVC